MSAAALPRVSIEAFESGEIDVEAFDHEAHIYLGWLYVTRYETPDAICRLCTALKELTAGLGIPDKYHETITWFFLLLIAERRAASPAADWFSFRRNNDDLFSRGDDSILHRHYRHETLGSQLARETFVLPDRLADAA